MFQIFDNGEGGLWKEGGGWKGSKGKTRTFLEGSEGGS